MKIEILLFGSLCEKIGNATMKVDNIKSTNELLSFIHNNYPSLEKTKFKIAVNKEIISENITLNEKDEIALLPSFSGG